LTFTSALICLSLAIYFEARNQPLEGQVAVAQVVLNRVADDRYPNKVCEVVMQTSKYRASGHPKLNSCQFSFFCDGKSDIPTDMDAYRWSQHVALGVLYGGFSNPVEKATHYHTVYVSPKWRWIKEPVTLIGDHIFYK
tara:strand:- start:1422 stop:1835 length:414 start_codon:yes stop_codon:yes gene_type:complete